MKSVRFKRYKRYKKGQLITLFGPTLYDKKLKIIARIDHDPKGCMKCIFYDTFLCNSRNGNLVKKLTLKGESLSCYSILGTSGYFKKVKTILVKN